ncbi:serine/threonine-protein phosphatase [Roseococcus sp. SYP-B2431]|uniref:PP2C family protein-serine/threonine phosphatase n=1 Tax=Roseococcus sp. SYP-B2431 TaxID=2496640 RepID=UPI00103992FF|nr:protein phosphatase 2C domain-containing protein [Roseococcus sp. SYP-B2431]TCH99479.1 serine/threonine-protein phosphatase [Roseococcus sp. SYP-B2431]
MRATLLASSAATHPGAVRTRNEDNLVDRPDLGLWAVADGAGGHGAGDVASTAIADALSAIPPGLTAAEMLAQVRLRLAGVHAELQARAEARGTGGVIASTIVVLLARGAYFAALWAGDSRIYLMRDGQLLRLTRDHSLVQELVDAGEIDAADAEAHPRANVITRAVGAGGELVLDKVADRIQPGDRYMLCSDGVFKELPEARIAALLSQGARAEDLVRLAVEAGGRDNVSVVLIEA